MVGSSIVIGDGDAIILRNHGRVNGQGAFFGMQPGHGILAKVTDGAGELDFVPHPGCVVVQVRMREVR